MQGVHHRKKLRLGAVLLMLAVPVFAQEESNYEPTVSLNIIEMQLHEAMQVLSDATGFNILLSNQANGQVNAFIRDMPPTQALKQTIEVNGFRYVRNGDVVWVLTQEEYIEDFNRGRVRHVVPLKHARVLDIAALVQDSASPMARILPYPETNVLVVAELEERAADLLDLIHALDEAPLTRVFQLRHASVEEITPLLLPHVALPESLSSDFRTNQIALTATAEVLDRIGGLIRKFDVPDQVATRVYPLQYAQASDVAQVLREVLGEDAANGQERRSSRESASSAATDRRTFTTDPSRGRSAQPRAEWEAYRQRQQHSTTESTTGAPRAGASPNPAAPASSAPASPSSGRSEDGEAPLGTLANVTADPRTNAVIVTHVQSILERIEAIIKEIDVPSRFHSYAFRNVNPAELELETRLAPLLPEEPFLSVDPINKSVTFQAAPQQADEILGLLHAWDLPIRQVRIEAEILRVNVSLIQELGVSWEAVLEEATGAGVVDRVRGQVDFPAQIGDTDPQARLRIGTLSDEDYTVLLQALAEDNDAQVIARPRILVRDGQEALFSSVRDEPYTVVTVDGETNTTLEDVRFLNVGTTLIVAPLINEEHLVTMMVQLEISSLISVRDGIPVVDRASAQSSVSVANGGTIILGGLRQRNRSEVERGVPGLRKIPLLGALFRNRRNESKEAEILLILCPIITPTDDGPAPTIRALHEGQVDDLRGELP